MPRRREPTPVESDDPPSCTLAVDDIPDRIAQWHRLASAALIVETIDGGSRLTLPGGLGEEAERLAAAESRCCAFLTLAVRRSSERCVVEITTEHAAGTEAIALLTGSDLDGRA
ncbi:MAG: hypothetical protein AAGD33_02355 [Actinomycetota bacterium]